LEGKSTGTYIQDLKDYIQDKGVKGGRFIEEESTNTLKRLYSLSGFWENTDDPGICIPSSSQNSYACGSEGQESCTRQVDGCETLYYDNENKICTNQCGGFGQLGCPVEGNGQNGMLTGNTYFSRCNDPNHFVWINIKDDSDIYSCKPLPTKEEFLDIDSLTTSLEYVHAVAPRSQVNNPKVIALDNITRLIAKGTVSLLSNTASYRVAYAQRSGKYEFNDGKEKRIVQPILLSDEHFLPLIIPSGLQADIANFQVYFPDTKETAPLSHLFAVKIDEVSDTVDFFTTEFKDEDAAGRLHIHGANYANPASYMTIDCGNNKKVNVPVYVGQMPETSGRACIYGIFYSTFGYAPPNSIDAYRECGFQVSVEDGKTPPVNAKTIKIDKLHIEMQNFGPPIVYDYDLTKSKGRELVVDFRVIPTPTTRPTTNTPR